MVALWYALVLAPFIAIPIFWWSYQRKQAARERLAHERWHSVVQGAGKDSSGAAIPQSAVDTVKPVPQNGLPASMAGNNVFQRRERMLDPAETLAYYLLRNGLPDCEVLGRVRLDQLLEVTGGSGVATGGRLQGLAQHTVDFVICNKAMQPMAAVDVLDGEAGAVLTAAPDFKTRCLGQAGVRYVRVLRSALPKRQDVRAVVLGPAPSD